MVKGRAELGNETYVSVCVDLCNAENLVAGEEFANQGIGITYFSSAIKTLENLPLWREVISQGHCIGNGCLLGMTDHGTLLNWTIDMVEADVELNQNFFREFLGVTPQVFALDGWATEAGDGDYLPNLRSMFTCIRTLRMGCNSVPPPPQEVAQNRLEELAVGWNVLVVKELTQALATKVKPYNCLTVERLYELFAPRL